MKMEEVEKALEYLADTDTPYAESRANVKLLEHRLKVTKGITFLQSTGTVAEREAKSVASQVYGTVLDQYHDSVLEMETFIAKRKRAELIIEVWRTETSARKVGFNV